MYLVPILHCASYAGWYASYEHVVEDGVCKRVFYKPHTHGLQRVGITAFPVDTLCFGTREPCSYVIFYGEPGDNGPAPYPARGSSGNRV